MRLSLLWTLALTTLLVFPVFAAEPAVEIKATKPGATVTIDRMVGEDKALISVVGAKKMPLFGLTAIDFSIRQAGRKAKITSVQPLAESLDVPRHIVLVLDNSDSMRQRKAVEALLSGVDELLKIIRPIDSVYLVVFNNRQSTKIADRDLFVTTFASNQADELKEFVAGVYKNAVTPTTVLYDAMLAGVDILRTLPAEEPRFLVVFSDGEDLNSVVKREELSKAAQEAGRFDAYAIDYMPGATSDKFLASFAAKNSGQIWKATSEANLVPIFQSVASKMEYYYVVSYLFPPTGNLKITPAALTVDELQAGSGPVTSSIDAPALNLRPSIDTVYGIARWKAVLANGTGTLAELSGEGAPSAELLFPLNPAMSGLLMTGGDLRATLTLQDGKGQELVLAAPPVKVAAFRTSGTLTVDPQSLTVEEVRTVDASPMLGHIYFDKGSSEIPPHYVRLDGVEATAGFDEQGFRDTLEKYYQLLNIVGKRLADNPEATVTLVGCNADTGPEKGRKKLSAARAEAVRDYLQTVWAVAPERIAVEARNLPQVPSTSRNEEGQAENRRVEIRSEHPAILDLVRSTYLANRIDVPVLAIVPEIVSNRGISRWTVTVANSAGDIGRLNGDGAPVDRLEFPLPAGDLAALASGGDLTVTMEVQDRKGQTLMLTPQPVKVSFLQTSQRLAEKQGLKVQEKYALILFDFDKDTIDSRNQAIVDTIVTRIRELPQTTVEIVGHTDNLGKESYNQKLSERRALAVYKMLIAAYGEDSGERIRYRGVGPNEPLYENISPERRSFNRTVTITLDYLSAE